MAARVVGAQVRWPCVGSGGADATAAGEPPSLPPCEAARPLTSPGQVYPVVDPLHDLGEAVGVDLASRAHDPVAADGDRLFGHREGLTLERGWAREGDVVRPRTIRGGAGEHGDQAVGEREVIGARDDHDRASPALLATDA